MLLHVILSIGAVVCNNKMIIMLWYQYMYTHPKCMFAVNNNSQMKKLLAFSFRLVLTIPTSTHNFGKSLPFTHKLALYSLFT